MSTPVRRKRRANQSRERWSSPSPERSRLQRAPHSKRHINYAETDDSDNNSGSDDDIYFSKERSLPKKRKLDLPQTPPSSSPDPPDPSPTIQVIDLDSDSDSDSDDDDAAVEVKHEGSVSKIFKTLPVEIHQTVTRFLPTDRDITKYAGVCKATLAAITRSVWRERFCDAFDLVDGKSTEHLAQLYKRRIGLRNKYIAFDLQQFPRLDAGSRSWQLQHQTSLVKVVRDMIIQSNAWFGRDDDGYIITVGKNHTYLANWIIQEEEEQAPYLDLIDAILLTEHDWDSNVVISAKSEGSLVLVVQVCLAFLFLDYDVVLEFRNFHQSQAQAYADDSKQPVFVGKWKTDVNVRWLLHALNFFAFHFKRDHGEGILNQEYYHLPRHQLPQPWVGKLQDKTQALGTHWKGASTYMPIRDLADLRNTDEGEILVPIDDSEPIQDIDLFFDESKFSTAEWPRSFERMIETNPYLTDIDLTPSRAGKSRRSPSSTPNPSVRPEEYEFRSFFGSSDALVKTHYYGRIHGLPPQQGIPGFQRISFLRFQLTEKGGLDEKQIWAYEGCVLPGGRIIVGKWCPASNDDLNVDPVNRYSGPFIFWNVDNSTADPPIDKEAAVRFLDSLLLAGIAY